MKKKFYYVSFATTNGGWTLQDVIHQCDGAFNPLDFIDKQKQYHKVVVILSVIPMPEE